MKEIQEIPAVVKKKKKQEKSVEKLGIQIKANIQLDAEHFKWVGMQNVDLILKS